MHPQHSAETWTIERASREFGINPRTLSARLTQGGIKESESGGWSTKQICAAVFGDIAGEKLRKVKQEADKLEIENRRTLGDLIDVPAVVEVGQRFTFAVRQIIVNSKLSLEDKQAIFNELSAVTDADWSKRETYADAEPS